MVRMKILELHINHFGALQDQRFTFTDGLNVLCHENGFGKSTLLSYVKAMFYGFNDTRSQSLEENDRKKYLPWGGGTCGGSLIFELEGTRYRIERVFGKRASEDTLTVYNETRGTITPHFGENPGLSIFKIDAEGFLRTLALSERVFREEENKSVSGRLSEVVGTGGAMDGLQEALNLLSKQQSELTKRSRRGVLDTIKEKIAEDEAELQRITQQTQSLPLLMKSIEQTRGEIEAVEGELSRLQKELMEDTSVGEEALRKKQLDDVQKKLNELRQKFYVGVPTEEEIDEIQRCDGLYSESEIKAYQALRSRFEGRTNQQEIEAYQTELLTIETNASADDGLAFLGAHPTLNALDGIGESEIREYPKTLMKGRFLSLAVILLVTGALFLLGGFFVAPLFFVSVVLWVACALVFALRPKASISDATAKTIQEVLLAEGITDIEALLTLQREREKAIRNADMAKEREEKKANILAFLARLGYTGTPLKECFAQLTSDFSRYNAFCIREFDKAERISARVKTFLDKYSHFGTPPYNQLRTDLFQLKTLEKQELQMLSAPVFDAMAERKQKELYVVELRARIAQLQEAINAMTVEREKIEEKDDKRQELLSSMEESRMEMEKYQSRLRVLEQAEEKLKLAKEEMQSSYLMPTRERFDAILQMLTDLNAGDVYLGSDFKLAYKKQGGLSHDMTAMSRGERDLYLLIARFAIVDTLYPDGTLPPILLDDPFVAFDDGRVTKALGYLDALAEKRQILYFTCSGARAK